MTAAGKTPDPARKPNIVLILTDDQGWGDVSAHGNDKIHTPNMDKLAHGGAWFDRFFVSPVCAPTRASILTGRYHLRAGCHGVTRGKERLNLNEVTLADVLEADGYATGCFGKWHSGSQYPYHPNGRGFGEFYGFCAGHWNNYFDTTLDHNGKTVRSSGFIIDDLTDKAMAFIEANRKKPFFCYVPFNTPHTPWQVPDKYFDRVKERDIDKPNTVCAYAMCENVDDNIGRILAKLDGLNLTEQTLVIFLSDNGPNGARWNGGMKGVKGSTHEGGVRSPTFWYWPGTIKPRKIEQIASHIDMMPTLLELCGITNAKTLPFDGVSLTPLLEGRAKDWPDRRIFSTWGRKVSVRTQQYRADEKSLYDMIKDPGQKHDLAKQLPEVHRKLADACLQWKQELSQGLDTPRPYPVGHAAADETVLPSHEAELTGKGIGYNGKAGWANDWVDHWTDTDAYPRWPVEIATTGRYQVTLMYCCGQADVGATVEVRIGDAKVAGKITKTHDPDPIPSPDRIPRKEVYEKVWAPLDLGAVELAKGACDLTVRALAKPGKHVMQLKDVRLKRLQTTGRPTGSEQSTC